MKHNLFNRLTKNNLLSVLKLSEFVKQSKEKYRNADSFSPENNRVKSIGFVMVVILATTGWFASHFIVPSSVTVETSELDNARKPRSEKTFFVQAINSTASSYERTQKFSTKLQAFRRTKISTKIDSTVQTIPVAMGQTVKKDAPIITLKPGAFPANLARTKALLTKQEILLKTTQRLHAQKKRSDTQLSDAKANYNIALANYINAKEQNDGITVRAPYDGIIESIDTEIGEKVKNGQIVATISDITAVKTTVYASEKQIDQITMGQNVELSLRNGKRMQGYVARIAVRSNEKTHTFAVEIHAKNTVNAKDGLTASALLKIGTVTVHNIPTSVLTLSDSGEFGVRLVEYGKVSFYPVTIEQETDDGIFVSGLPNTAQIITVGQEYVRAGDNVSVTIQEK